MKFLINEFTFRNGQLDWYHPSVGLLGISTVSIEMRWWYAVIYRVKFTLNCRLIYTSRFGFGLLFLVGNGMIIFNIWHFLILNGWLENYCCIILAIPFSLNIFSVSLTIQLYSLEFLQYLLKWFYEISNLADDTAAEAS